MIYSTSVSQPDGLTLQDDVAPMQTVGGVAPRSVPSPPRDTNIPTGDRHARFWSAGAPRYGQSLSVKIDGAGGSPDVVGGGGCRRVVVGAEL